MAPLRQMIGIVQPIQLKMARAALGLSIVAFAQDAGVSHETIVRFERGEKLKDSTVMNFRRAMERAGIVLLSDDGECGPGIRVSRTAGAV